MKIADLNAARTADDTCVVFIRKGLMGTGEVKLKRYGSLLNLSCASNNDAIK